MNLTEFQNNPLLPSKAFIDFYYYYSFFTLTLSWTMLPFLSYVIITQSKEMKSFKWLLLNHTFWCLAFETFFATIKPLVLSPITAGYPLGFLRNGSFQVTVIATVIGFILIANCVTSLMATLLSRYMLAFPHGRFTKFCNIKFFIIFTVIISVFGYSILLLMFIPLSKIDEELDKQWAIEFSPFLKESALTENGFFYIPFEMAKSGIMIFFISLILCSIGGIIFLAYFFYLIKSNNTQTAIKLRRSLIISSMAQMFITGFFLNQPIIMLLSALLFQVENTANLICFSCCLFVSHSLMEFFATLYYVAPYRRYICKIWCKIFGPVFKRKIQIVEPSNFSLRTSQF